MTEAVLEPKDMEWKEKGVLGIEWTDGHKGLYPVRYLRQHCPCAACTDEWSGELRLNPDDVPLLIRLEDVELVGRYALQFKWSDGHDSGIYSWTWLYGLGIHEEENWQDYLERLKAAGKERAPGNFKAL